MLERPRETVVTDGMGMVGGEVLNLRAGMGGGAVVAIIIIIIIIIIIGSSRSPRGNTGKG